jgi:hypothetical protein
MTEPVSTNTLCWVNSIGTTYPASVNARDDPSLSGKSMHMINSIGELAFYWGSRTDKQRMTWSEYRFLNKDVTYFIRDDVHKRAVLSGNPHVELMVPYVSQHGTGADKYRNDCGPAAVASVLKYVSPREISVTQVAEASGMIDENLGQFFNLDRAANAYKLDGTHMRPFHISDIIDSINAMVPTISLVNYGAWYDEKNDAKQYGHFVVVIGYQLVAPENIADHTASEGLEIIYHDPNKAGHMHMPARLFGEAYAYLRARYNKVTKKQNNNMPFQSMIFKEKSV